MFRRFMLWFIGFMLIVSAFMLICQNSMLMQAALCLSRFIYAYPKRNMLIADTDLYLTANTR
ncbi:hypothetical protein CUU66_08570 [Peribacillus deserti]|uniref:Uncharacterized protein n=1 Tax=Peribacillus deserti TaxID=673318 RepID=A0A2N5M7E3_9BACI|nr:hypothetical protein CUU66_08570 [Peribacillus deserti]